MTLTAIELRVMASKEARKMLRHSNSFTTGHYLKLTNILYDFYNNGKMPPEVTK